MQTITTKNRTLAVCQAASHVWLLLVSTGDTAGCLLATYTAAR